MSEVEKKPLTNNESEIIFYGPKGKIEEAKKTMAKLGFIEVTDSIPASAVLPERTPGHLLAGLRYREGLTQQELSQKTEIPRRHISEMENDKRSIGKKRAMILAKALSAVDYRILL